VWGGVGGGRMDWEDVDVTDAPNQTWLTLTVQVSGQTVAGNVVDKADGSMLGHFFADLSQGPPLTQPVEGGLPVLPVLAGQGSAGLRTYFCPAKFANFVVAGNSGPVNPPEDGEAKVIVNPWGTKVVTDALAVATPAPTLPVHDELLEEVQDVEEAVLQVLGQLEDSIAEAEKKMEANSPNAPEVKKLLRMPYRNQAIPPVEAEEEENAAGMVGLTNMDPAAEEEAPPVSEKAKQELQKLQGMAAMIRGVLAGDTKITRDGITAPADDNKSVFEVKLNRLRLLSTRHDMLGHPLPAGEYDRSGVADEFGGAFMPTELVKMLGVGTSDVNVTFFAHLWHSASCPSLGFTFNLGERENCFPGLHMAEHSCNGLSLTLVADSERDVNGALIFIDDNLVAFKPSEDFFKPRALEIRAHFQPLFEEQEEGEEGDELNQDRDLQPPERIGVTYYIAGEKLHDRIEYPAEEARALIEGRPKLAFTAMTDSCYEQHGLVDAVEVSTAKDLTPLDKELLHSFFNTPDHELFDLLGSIQGFTNVLSDFAKNTWRTSSQGENIPENTTASAVPVHTYALVILVTALLAFTVVSYFRKPFDGHEGYEQL